jgi:hypothetical protein
MRQGTRRRSDLPRWRPEFVDRPEVTGGRGSHSPEHGRFSGFTRKRKLHSTSQTEFIFLPLVAIGNQD